MYYSHICGGGLETKNGELRAEATSVSSNPTYCGRRGYTAVERRYT
jgi:hypothetical protein